MSHLIVLPVILPALLGPFIIMVIRHQLDLQRVFSVAGSVALLVISLILASQVVDGSVQVYELGDWPAPFGIVLVLDRLSAAMLVLTTILGLAVVLYAIGTGWDNRGRNFHALIQFQFMGILGAFLTGDAFNLFVFFEVLLIASYGLMIHGGGAVRLQAGVQYVVYNLLGSTLFLFALGTIYGVTGTLNMADIAVRVAELPAEDTALLRVGAVMLLLVFAIKGAVLPLHFWLPATYANAPLPIAALFAIMTKVGAYAIIRMYTLAFGPDVEITSGLVGEWLLPAALLTLVVGSIGVLGTKELGRLVAFGSIASVGTLLTAIALFTPEATAVAIYYTIHSTLASAILFLVADMVVERRNGLISAQAPMPENGLISALFFVGAIALAGMPPLSGFVGKLLVMDAARTSDLAWTIWAVILITSLVTIVGFARAGVMVFWKSYDAGTEVSQSDEERADPEFGTLPFVAVFGLIGGLVLLTIFSGPVMSYAEATAAMLYDPDIYIDAVLKRTAQ